MLILKDLNERYLIRTALYDSTRGSCIEITCRSSDPEKLAALLSIIFQDDIFIQNHICTFGVVFDAPKVQYLSQGASPCSLTTWTGR